MESAILFYMYTQLSEKESATGLSSLETHFLNLLNLRNDLFETRNRVLKVQSDIQKILHPDKSETEKELPPKKAGKVKVTPALPEDTHF